MYPAKFRDPATGEFVDFPGMVGAKGDTGQSGPNEVSTTTNSAISGLLKGAGGKVAPAVAGTDYATPAQVQAVDQKAENNATQLAAIANGKIYAVTWTPGQTSPTLTRALDAVGMRADVGTDVVTVYHNDFDSVAPWNRRKCCGDFDANGVMHVNAYLGEEGFATGGSNGNVWIEERLWFYRLDWENGFLGISGVQHSGYLPSPRFLRPDGSVAGVIYSPCYRLSTVAGKGASVSGQYPTYNGTTALHNLTRAYNAKGRLESIRDRLSDWMLSVVEYATFNHKAIMAGAQALDYNSMTSLVTAAGTTASVIVSNDTATKYVVGQTISIGIAQNGSNVADNRTITAIEAISGDSNNKRIVVTGAVFNSNVGNFLTSRGWRTGFSDALLHPSGSPCGTAVPASATKYPCCYRYSEITWGDMYSTLGDMLVNRVGAGTGEDPYAAEWYYLPDPGGYDGTLNANYVKLQGATLYQDGYVKNLTFDSRYPYCFVISELGASATTYLSAYHYVVSTATLRSVRAGGHWGNGTNCSPLYFYCGSAVETSSIHYGGGLSYPSRGV